VTKDKWEHLNKKKDIAGKAECNIKCYEAGTKAIEHEHMKWSPIIHKTEIHKHYNSIINGTSTM